MRNLKRIVYVGPHSWPLLSTLQIFAKAQACVPDLELAIVRTSYISNPPDDNPQIIHAHRKLNDDIERLMNHPGAYNRGRSTAYELKHGAVWCMPTHLADTHSETGKLAQYWGAIPVYSPVGPLAKDIFAGIPIYGLAAIDRLVICRFAYEIVRLATNPEIQEQIRVPMIARARAERKQERAA